MAPVSQAVSPGPAPCGPGTSSRRRGGGRKGALATQQVICPALPDWCHAQYRSLFQLGVLLTCDADAAEAVVLGCSTALHRLRKRPQTEDDALPHLRRLVARSWRPGITISRRQQAAPRGAGPPGCTGTPHGAPWPKARV